jgi:hypothetical protein
MSVKSAGGGVNNMNDFYLGAQVQVHLSAGLRLQRVRLLVHEEGQQEDAEQGRGEGNDAGLGEGSQHLLSQQRSQ